MEPKREVGAAVSVLEGAPKIDGAGPLDSGSLDSGFCGGAGSSSISSIDSVGGLVLLLLDTMSSMDSPNENSPEGLSGLGPSLTAVPSPLNVDPNTKPLELCPKALFVSPEVGGGNAVSVSVLAPNGDGTDDFANALSPDILAKGDSVVVFDAAKPANPPPEEFAKEPNPPPVLVVEAPNRLLPGVDGCPKPDPPPSAPKPDLPNWGDAVPKALGAPKEAPGCDGVPKEGAPNDVFPKAGCWLAPKVEVLPNAGAADGLPKGDAPSGDGLPKADCPNAGCAGG